MARGASGSRNELTTIGASLGTPGNMPNPGQFATSTTRSEARIVHNVHTPKFRTLSTRSASRALAERRGFVHELSQQERQLMLEVELNRGDLASCQVCSSWLAAWSRTTTSSVATEQAQTDRLLVAQDVPQLAGEVFLEEAMVCVQNLPSARRAYHHFVNAQPLSAPSPQSPSLPQRRQRSYRPPSSACSTCQSWRRFNLHSRAWTMATPI